MDEYSANWLDYCDKGQKAIENAIDYILREYGKAKDVNQFDLEKRCGINLRFILILFILNIKPHLKH